jgi:hypothetical protein
LGAYAILLIANSIIVLLLLMYQELKVIEVASAIKRYYSLLARAIMLYSSTHTSRAKSFLQLIYFLIQEWASMVFI